MRWPTHTQWKNVHNLRCADALISYGKFAFQQDGTMFAEVRLDSNAESYFFLDGLKIIWTCILTHLSGHGSLACQIRKIFPQWMGPRYWGI